MTSSDQPTPGFDSELAIRAVSATTWALTAPLVWTGNQGDTFTVPAGFVTDFATSPRILHWRVLPYGPYTRAAVLHDWLLVSLAKWQDAKDSGAVMDWDPPANSRDTDGIFRVAMRHLGTPWATRWTMWAAVRLAALTNHRRAYGRQFARDLPRVAGICLIAIPINILGVVGVGLSLLLGAPFGLIKPRRH